MKSESIITTMSVFFIITSDVFAADAGIVGEPEPAEYVRVCDVNGTGFFYIPGTENCLRIGGYVQQDIGAGGLFGRTSWDKKDGAPNLNDTYSVRTRLSLQLDARSETELGTLRSFAEVWFDYGSTRGAFSDVANSWELKHGYIELGGLRVGKSDSLFRTVTLLGGNVVNDSLVEYSPIPTNQMSYTFRALNGFTAVVALEQGNGAHTIDSYVPHVVAGAAFKQGWGSITSVVGYDSNYEEWAGKVRLDLKASDAISLWAMVGYGTDDHVAKSFYKPWGGNWAIWGGGTTKLSSKASVNLALGYDEDENFGLVAGVKYDMVPGFYVQPEIAYKSTSNPSNADEFGGSVRFRRSF